MPVSRTPLEAHIEEARACALCRDLPLGPKRWFAEDVLLLLRARVAKALDNG
jgi:hypothetical protein